MKSFFTETTSTGNYFDPLTGLRGLAAIAVLFYHVFVVLVPVSGSEHWFANHVILPMGASGFLGVQLFFVLSGFLLSFYFLSAHKKGGKPSYLHFMKNRCLRVLPSFYFQLVALSLMYYLLSVKTIDLRNLTLHALMLHNLDYRISGSINGVFWTLPIEWNFYYIMPFFAVLLTKKRWIWLFCGAVILGLSCRYILGEYVIPEGSNIFFRIGLLTQVFSIPEYFVFGMVMAYLRYNLTPESKYLRYGDAVMILGAVAFCWSVNLVNWNTYWTTSQHYIWNSIAPLALAIFVLGASLNGWLARKIFANRLMLVFGILSYGLYLWHVIVIELIKGHLFKGVNLLPYLSRFNDTQVTKLLVTSAIVLSLTLVIAYLNYRFIEKPFLALKYVNKSDKAT